MDRRLRAESRAWWLATILCPALSGPVVCGLLLVQTGARLPDLPFALALLLAVPVLIVNGTSLLLWRLLPGRLILPVRRPGSGRIFLHLTPHTYGAFVVQSPLGLGRALHREVKALLRRSGTATLVLETSLHIDPRLLRQLPAVREVRLAFRPPAVGGRRLAQLLFITLLTWPVFVWIHPGSYRRAMAIYLRPRRRLEIEPVRRDPAK